MEVLARKIEKERLKMGEAILEILLQKKEEMSTEDKTLLFDYIGCCLDELMIETTKVITHLELLDMSMMEAIAIRQAHWQAEEFV